MDGEDCIGQVSLVHCAPTFQARNREVVACTDSLMQLTRFVCVPARLGVFGRDNRDSDAGPRRLSEAMVNQPVGVPMIMQPQWQRRSRP